MSTPTAYSSAAKGLHWVMALLIISLICVGLWMTGLPKGDFRGQVYGLHKAFGVIVLALLMVRIAIRLSKGAPALPDTMPANEQKLAHLGHLALYALMLVIPVAGIVMSQSGGHQVSVFGLVLPTLVAKSEPLFKVAQTCHAVAGWTIGILVIGHVAAAVRHHHILKDDVLKRMLPECKCCKAKQH